LKQVKLIAQSIVAERYLVTTARYCIPVAATLGLHPLFPEWRQIMLTWTKEVKNSRWAIAYGALQLSLFPARASEGKRKFFRSVEECVDPEIKPYLQDLRGRDLATWEFKSLSAADHLVFKEIAKMALAREFPWQTCQRVCPHDIDLNVTPETVPRGFDASSPLWKLPANPAESFTGIDSRLSTGRSTALPSPALLDLYDPVYRYIKVRHWAPSQWTRSSA
jgi:hypothetical protein